MPRAALFNSSIICHSSSARPTGRSPSIMMEVLLALLALLGLAATTAVPLLEVLSTLPLEEEAKAPEVEVKAGVEVLPEG